MSKYLRWFTAGLLMVGLAGNAMAVSSILREIEEAYTRLHETVRPSVVNIETTSERPRDEQQAPQGLEDLFRFFGTPEPNQQPRPPRRGKSTGSGFIYDKEGHIITNNHVVADATTITVRLWDGVELDAEVVGTDPDSDLAVIKVTTDHDLPVAKLGDSDTLRVGQFAIATGSPRGFEGSLSFGHISALGRENLDGLRTMGLRFQGLIQTDAAINLGNSGGPLCNIDGEVIGINVAIVWGAQSLGFAIPVNRAREVVPQLIATGKVVRGWLGVSITDLKRYAESEEVSTPVQDLVKVLGVPDEQGAYVHGVTGPAVTPGGPAEKAGLKEGDLIRMMDGTVVADAQDLVERVSTSAPGTEVKFEVWRDGGSVELTVTLGEFPDMKTALYGAAFLGIRVQPLTQEIVEQLGIEPGTKGVIVTDVEPDSAAAEKDIQHGDIITKIAHQEVTNPDEFRRILEESAAPGQPLLFDIIGRDGRLMRKVIRVPEE